MERTTRPWQWLLIAAVVATGTILTSVVARWPAAVPPESLPDGAEPVAREAAARPSEPIDSQRAKLEELRAMSETFRNTTFLIAIRDMGYLCSELVSVYGGMDDSTTWTVACREMLAYAVSVSYAGALHVEPTVHHLDAQFPNVRQDQAPPSPPPR